MKTKQNKLASRGKPIYFLGMVLLTLIFMTGCSEDDSDDAQTDDQVSGEYPESYVKFTISGSTLNGDYEFSDLSEDDEFTTSGHLYTKESDPDLPEDQIQVSVRKSYTESNFLLVASPETGSRNIIYTGGPNDFDVRVLLSTEENYYAKEVSVNITELEIAESGRVVSCKGTFTGDFYRNNLVEDDVHEIEGTFEIRQ
ncbi:hypothetical protein J8L85_05740 [Maribacter sp. MMG018]|uniref:hypothetical protein n=1 Tax=Maribacter sp. MMG018 TaxID=2822688 RepID=UPI001B381458|nr:hypothetical protein [Maribacter sp. MMG018]MBQ4913929.1 hypothetical protein [Maribacter sp. MMG018]